MIARIFYVSVYMAVCAASTYLFLDETLDWTRMGKYAEDATQRFYVKLRERNGKPVHRHVVQANEEEPLPDRGQAPHDVIGQKIEDMASNKAQGDEVDPVVGLGNDELVVPEPVFDREGLELLFAAAQDFDTELEFIVPKPVRARPPSKGNREVPAPIDYLKVPKPQLAQRPPKRDIRPPEIVKRGLTRLVSFENAPFPYSGRIGNTKRPFLNVTKDGRRGHRTRTGRLYWADTTYSDRRSLLHIPQGFDLYTPGVMVVFFHGWGAKLKRDIWKRQKLPHQITASGTNAVLIAPQFGVNARDSSIGNFWRPGAVRDYLDEAAVHLARMAGKPEKADAFRDMPVVLVGYSGGYVPTAWALARGGIGERVIGVVLLDALYGQLGTFTKWIRNARHTFFVSAHMSSTRKGNNRLRSVMEKRGINYDGELDGMLYPGSVKIIHAPERHRSYVTMAWTENPVSDVLKRLPGLPRRDRGDNRITSRLSIGR